MKLDTRKIKRFLLFGLVLFVWSLVFVNHAPAPPPPPPPPSAPAAGDIAQAAAMGAVALYGAFRIWRKK